MIRLKTAKEHTTTQWSGGESAELALFPASGSYADRNFDCRVSTATVTQSGPFTDLPGFRRTLCLLEGDGMELSIAGKKPVRLDETFAAMYFDGGDKTVARLLGGAVRDFNVIHRPGVKTTLRVVPVSARGEETIHENLTAAAKEIMLFCPSGTIDIAYRKREYQLHPLDAAFITLAPGARERIMARGPGALIEVGIEL